jgi:hypothetical protein
VYTYSSICWEEDNQILPLYLGDLENGIILKNVNEPIVRFTNISHEEVLNDFKELQRLEEEMDKVRNRIRDFI